MEIEIQEPRKGIKGLKRKDLKKRASDRREKIRQMILKDGFSKLPTIRKLSAEFNVSFQVIIEDIKKIKGELPGESTILAAASYSEFVKDCIRKLEDDLKNSAGNDLMSRRYRKDTILAMALLLEKEINLKMRLGVLDNPEKTKKQEGRVVLTWKSGRRLIPNQQKNEETDIEEDKVIDLNEKEYEKLDSSENEDSTSEGDAEKTDI